MPRLDQLLSSADPLMTTAARVLLESFGRDRAAPAVGVYVPGRVEFLGKHTDYAGGRSLLLAVERGFRLVAVPRQDKLLRVIADAEAGTLQQFAFGQTPPHEPGHWINYVATVSRRVQKNFADAVDLRGADMAFVSDLPPASGMSSSSALMVTTFLALSAVNRLDRADAYGREIRSRLQLAEYLGCVENGQSFGALAGEAGVGTFGGSEDHTAMLCCKQDMLSQYSFAPGAFERDIRWPAGVDMVIACSGVEAPKTGSARDKYNRVSLRARKAAEAFNRATGNTCTRLREIALRLGPDGLKEATEAIARGAAGDEKDLDLPGRFEQFFREDQQLIPAVGDALAAGDVHAIGPLVDQSHRAAERGLRNQIEQTNFLQSSARQLGAVAASYFGAGFGGSAWAMIQKQRTAEFVSSWKNAYGLRFPQQAGKSEFFVTRAGPPAQVLE